MLSYELIEKCPSFLSELKPNFEIDELSFSTDSRKLEMANTFVCLYGPNFDAHEFVENIFDTNIEVIIVQKDRFKLTEESIPERIQLIYVTNTFEFIKELASLRIDDWKDKGGTVIGITGSNGKTTNKEMLDHLARNIIGDQVLSTKGNLNNHIGVPLTIFSIKDSHSLAIIEMGSNSPGEIEELGHISKPDFALITSIGPAHLEFLIDLEGVFKEKSSLFHALKKFSRTDLPKNFVVNIDDPFLSRLSCEDNVVSLGENKGDWKIEIGFDFLTLKNDSESLVLKNSEIVAKHNWVNMAQCFLMMSLIYPGQREELLKAVESFHMPNLNRGDWVEFEDMQVFLDAYNANPASVMASLEGFFLKLKKAGVNLSQSLIILGDMNELGDGTSGFHHDVGKSLSQRDIGQVVFVGRYAKFYQSGYGEKAIVFDNAQQVRDEFNKLRNSFSHVFIKGSRSLQLESILDIKV